MAIFKKDKKTKVLTAKPTVDGVESTPRAVANRGSAFRILARPLLSEKTTRGEARGTYTFAVAMDATKTEISQAVETVYGVRPKHVRTSVVEGKIGRFGRTIGRRASWKKAIITLPAGKTISIHTGV